MSMKNRIAVLITGLLFSCTALAERVVRAEIQAAPQADSMAEFGLIYSNTGLIPARLQLYCQDFVDEAGWNGMLPGNERPCGGVDLQIRLTSLGLSAFFMNYSKANPLTVDLHVDPQMAELRSILGIYIGAKAGAGLAVGARTMVLRNDTSGVWATTGQTLASGSDGMGIGVDFSVPWLEVYLLKAADLRRPLSAFKQAPVAPQKTAAADGSQKNL